MIPRLGGADSYEGIEFFRTLRSVLIDSRDRNAPSYLQCPDKVNRVAGDAVSGITENWR